MATDGKKSAAEGVMDRRDEFKIGYPTITIAAAANFIVDHAPPGTDRAKAYHSAYSDIKCPLQSLSSVDMRLRDWW